MDLLPHVEIETATSSTSVFSMLFPGICSSLGFGGSEQPAAAPAAAEAAMTYNDVQGPRSKGYVPFAWTTELKHRGPGEWGRCKELIYTSSLLSEPWFAASRQNVVAYEKAKTTEKTLTVSANFSWAILSQNRHTWREDCFESGLFLVGCVFLPRGTCTSFNQPVKSRDRQVLRTGTGNVPYRFFCWGSLCVQYCCWTLSLCSRG